MYELTEEILRKEIIVESLINPTAPKDFDSDEDDMKETNNISWNQAADVMKLFI